MDEREMEIEVRTLTGETITVSISSNRTIQELKLLLTQILPPETSSSNFHLFFKGRKLSLQSQISSNLISHGEFIVLVPFTRRDKQQAVNPGANETIPQNDHQCSTSKFAESAWSDMMQDLSSLWEREIDGTESQPPVDFEVTYADTQKEASGRNCEGLFDEAIHEIVNSLQLCDNDEPDEKVFERFMQVLDSVNCLSDPKTRNCMLKNTNIRSSGVGRAADNDISYSCICPSWLAGVLKAFYFLNIYCTFLQMQQKKVTQLCVEGGLNQLRKFGLGFEYADLENLSLLCPKVIQFIDNDTKDRRSNSVIVVIKSRLDIKYPVKGKKKVSAGSVVNAMRKRESAFKADLRATVKSFMQKKGNETIKLYSLNDLLRHVNEGKGTKTDAKQTRRSLSEPSGSFSPDAMCYEANPLLPTEMVDHLRAGIGSQGQMVHVEEIDGRIANFKEIPCYLSERIQSALKSSGVSKLYRHQVFVGRVN